MLISEMLQARMSDSLLWSWDKNTFCGNPIDSRPGRQDGQTGIDEARQAGGTGKRERYRPGRQVSKQESHVG